MVEKEQPGSEFHVKKNSPTDHNWVYLQWCLHTGLYMLEPWERSWFNGFVVLSIALIMSATVAIVSL
ncbi:hypothetical protein QR680_015486 [Steinernema hermaphroditum]|uniref:Uncharacterized protein n=1 Tax=Steinernema hermaphroditum TaxID=289476 RepID=A0AA39LKX9_9BILA|nr:hypothetical protein QR680_015486 [Steinernema hermaphroditum]